MLSLTTPAHLRYNEVGYSDTVILTSILYEDTIEGQTRAELFFEFLEKSKETDIHIVVADGGSSPDTLKRISLYSNVTVITFEDNVQLQKSMGPKRREGLRVAMEMFPEAKYFYWTEPEKIDLLSKENLDRVLSPLRNDSKEQVIPTAKPNDDRPAYMRAIEMRAMRRAMDIVNTGKYNPKDALGDNVYVEPTDLNGFVDHWFGPRVFTREIAEKYYMKNPGKLWDWHIISGAKAQEKGTTVSIPIVFNYPKVQKASEEDSESIDFYKQKRFSQYKNLIRAFRKEFIKEL